MNNPSKAMRNLYEDYNPRMPGDSYTSYDLARVSSVYRSWSRFKEQYPFNAELLKILFENQAKDAHMEVCVIPEDKARFIVEMLRKPSREQKGSRLENLIPMGDS